ncbi:hypothetical protein V6N13_040209 [Hibiscus sabdariffa]
MKWTQANGSRPSGICKSKTSFGGPHGYALGVSCIGAMNSTGSCEFKKKVNKIYLSWKHCYRVKSAGSEDNMVTPNYVVWMRIRVNDTILLPNQGQTMSMEEHLRVIPLEADTLRNELEATRLKMEEIDVRHERDLYMEKLEVDKFAGEAEQAVKKYSDLKIKYNIQNNNFKKLEASVKHMELQSEKTKGKKTIEQYQQALKVEKDNTVAWKRKSHDSKIRLTESQNAYNTLEIQLNQSRAQYLQLETRVREQENMIHEYQTRDEYAELQAGRDKIERLEKEVKDLWELVQKCQISLQEQDKINEKIMNLAQDVAEHVTTLAREARILRPHVVSNEMKSSLELLFDQIEDLGTRVKPYFPRD